MNEPCIENTYFLLHPVLTWKERKRDAVYYKHLFQKFKPNFPHDATYLQHLSSTAMKRPLGYELGDWTTLLETNITYEALNSELIFLGLPSVLT